MKRKQARELCMQLVYEMIIKDQFSMEGYQRYLEEELEKTGRQDSYIRQLLTSVMSRHEELDTLVRSYSIDWHMERIARVDLAILYVAMAEMLDLSDVPSHVSVNEAVDLAKKYSTDKSASFVNGILGTYLKDRGEDRHADG